MRIILRRFFNKQICRYCGFVRPDCLCAISTRVANDNAHDNEYFKRGNI